MLIWCDAPQGHGWRYCWAPQGEGGLPGLAGRRGGWGWGGWTTLPQPSSSWWCRVS